MIEWGTSDSKHETTDVSKVRCFISNIAKI